MPKLLRRYCAVIILMSSCAPYSTKADDYTVNNTECFDDSKLAEIAHLKMDCSALKRDYLQLQESYQKLATEDTKWYQEPAVIVGGMIIVFGGGMLAGMKVK